MHGGTGDGSDQPRHSTVRRGVPDNGGEGARIPGGPIRRVELPKDCGPVEDLGEACFQAQLVDEQAVQFGERCSEWFAAKFPELAFCLLRPCAAPLDRACDFHVVIHLCVPCC
jgi:hypothetical protein